MKIASKCVIFDFQFWQAVETQFINVLGFKFGTRDGLFAITCEHNEVIWTARDKNMNIFYYKLTLVILLSFFNYFAKLFRFIYLFQCSNVIMVLSQINSPERYDCMFDLVFCMLCIRESFSLTYLNTTQFWLGITRDLEF